MLAVAFALPDESRAVAARLYHAGEDRGALLGSAGATEVALFHTGVGAARVRERLPRFLEAHKVERLVCAGYGGALATELVAGEVVVGSNYSDPAWAAAAQAVLGCRAGRFVSVAEPVETPLAKAALAAQTGAAVVDQETEAVAEICRAHGLPLLALRAITDTAREELPVPFGVCFDAATERPRVGALLGYLLRHPGRILPFADFAGRVARAREALAGAVERLASAPKAAEGCRTARLAGSAEWLRCQ